MAESFIPTKLILADDDKDDVLLFRTALTDLQLAVEIIQVRDGEELLHELNKPGLCADIIFMDVNMPRKNGLTCLKEIRKSVIYQQLPVVILSTSREVSVVTDFYLAGARYYICKSSDYRQFKTCIKNVFQLLQQDHLTQPPRLEFELS